MDGEEPSPIRRAAFRGLVCALALAVLLTVFEVIAFLIRGWTADATVQVFLGGPLVGILGGLSAIPIGYVELTLARRPASLKRDLAGGVLTYVVAFLVLTLAFLQFWYTFNLAITQSFARATHEVTRLLGWFADFPVEFSLCLAAGAVPFGFLAASRLHGHHVPAQTVLVGTGTALLATPLLLAVTPTWYEVPREDVIAWIVLAGALIPLLAWIGDVLERRVVRFLSPSA
jgi:hypothetical protein